MDITPKVINEIEFPLKVRGYDPDEVDDFLERMAVGVGQLQERLEQVAERAAAAERRVAELEQSGPRPSREAPPVAEARPPVADQTEELSRTLVMAQRFVDQAMNEATADAERLRSDARADADRRRSETEAEVRRMRTESEAQIVEEVRQLESTRDALRSDIDALTGHLDEQRERLRSSLADFHKLLDEPDRLRAAPAPELNGAGLPEFAHEIGATPRPDAPPALTSVPADDDDEAPVAEVAPAMIASRPEPEPDLSAAAPIRAVADAEDEDDAWSRFARGPEPVQEGPPTAVHLESGGDRYLAELGREMGEHPSVAPAPPAPPENFFDQDAEASRRRLR